MNSLTKLPDDAELAALSQLAGSTLDLVVAAIPRETVERLLDSAIADLVGTAEILRFNRQHKQWDIMREHLDSMRRKQAVVRSYADALARSNQKIGDA